MTDETPRHDGEVPTGPSPKRDSRSLAAAMMFAALVQGKPAAEVLGEFARMKRAMGDEGGSKPPPPPAEAQGEDRLERIRRYFDGLRANLASLEERAERGEGANLDLTYGRTRAHVVLEILDAVQAGPDDVFVDLGSGAGEAVIVAAERCREARGVELLDRLHEAAEEARRALDATNVRFVHGDLRDLDVSDATVIYAYSTCFTPPLVAAVAEKAAEAPLGARVITTNFGLVHGRLDLVDKRTISWRTGVEGRTMREVVFFHERV